MYNVQPLGGWEKHELSFELDLQAARRAVTRNYYHFDGHHIELQRLLDRLEKRTAAKRETKWDPARHTGFKRQALERNDLSFYANKLRQPAPAAPSDKLLFNRNEVDTITGKNDEQMTNSGLKNPDDTCQPNVLTRGDTVDIILIEATADGAKNMKLAEGDGIYVTDENTLLKYHSDDESKEQEITTDETDYGSEDLEIITDNEIEEEDMEAVDNDAAYESGTEAVEDEAGAETNYPETIGDESDGSGAAEEVRKGETGDVESADELLISQESESQNGDGASSTGQIATEYAEKLNGLQKHETIEAESSQITKDANPTTSSDRESEFSKIGISYSHSKILMEEDEILLSAVTGLVGLRKIQFEKELFHNNWGINTTATAINNHSEEIADNLPSLKKLSDIGVTCNAENQFQTKQIHEKVQSLDSVLVHKNLEKPPVLENVLNQELEFHGNLKPRETELRSLSTSPTFIISETTNEDLGIPIEASTASSLHYLLVFIVIMTILRKTVIVLNRLSA